jgi:hypothetical protein
MNTKQIARAFATRQPGAAHNAKTDGREYRLHGHVIARHTDTGVTFDWCGWHTSTTARHMNALLDALGALKHVSYAQARDGKTPSVFTV